MYKQKSGVSPVVGILLLLGVTVGLIALTSQIVFDVVDDGDEGPRSSLEITHTENGNDADVTIRILRNRNIEEFSYIVESSSGSSDPETINDFDEPGDSATISVNTGDTVVIRGRIGSNLYVIDTYRIPQ